MAAANGASTGRDDVFERLLRQEELILDVTESLTEAIENTGITRAELARRLGRSPGFVSQLLGGGRNLTLRTIADISAALSLRPEFQFRRRESISQPIPIMYQTPAAQPWQVPYVAPSTSTDGTSTPVHAPIARSMGMPAAA